MTQQVVEDNGLRHRLLAACGVAHAFGTRSSVTPANVCRPKQVHATTVAHVRAGAAQPAEADAIVCASADQPIAVITADCVPILASSEDGSAVAAIHAGWRGLAAGVIAEGITALREIASADARIVAVVGPCIGGCCYEVDAPVLDPLRDRFGDRLDEAARASRPGHAHLDLASLAREDLFDSGVGAQDCASLPDACTSCHEERFHSYRRDGERAGRLVHHIRARPAS